MNNYCIVFDNQKIGIEIPVSSDSHTSDASKYICDNFLQFSELDEHGFRRLKKDVDYTSVSNAIKWGYSILPLWKNSCRSSINLHFLTNSKNQLVSCNNMQNNMKEIWLMICSGITLDRCSASSKDEASKIFKNRSRYEDWSESDILSEGDYFAETELNSLESQTCEG